MKPYYVNAISLSSHHFKSITIKVYFNLQPTYLLGIQNNDINVIRRLVNSWCKFNVKRDGKRIIDYAIEKKFFTAVDLFRSLEIQMDLCFAVMACNVKKVQYILLNHSNNLLLNFKNMVNLLLICQIQISFQLNCQYIFRKNKVQLYYRMLFEKKITKF